MGKLTGKIAWVTGAGSGIGEAVAERFAAEGAVTVITGRRHEKLEEVASRIRAAGGTAHVKPADLMRSAEVQRVADQIGAEFGRLDLLVSNAGLNITERDWKRISPEGIDVMLVT